MSQKQIKVKLVRSPTGCSERQKQTVKGLGLTKLNQIRSVIDTASSRGMVNKVSHLVSIVEQK